MRRLMGAVFLLAMPLAAEEPMRTLSSPHYKLYYESPFPPAGVLNDLEALHVKLLIDMNDFVPWANKEKITVYLYKDALSYRAKTGVAEWAAGHVDVRNRSVYCFEGEDFRRTMAHELAHLFLEDFFAQKDVSPPSWLNEGVATLMAQDHGLEASHPLPDLPLAALTEPLDTFFRFDYRHEQRADDAIALWYHQSYSVVRFLIRQFSQVQFYLFCKALRDGADLDKALSLAYGVQVWDVPSLERAWTKSLTRDAR